MTETLWAVVIGGLIAILGSAATQILLFWLNERMEKQQRRRVAIEFAAASFQRGLQLCGEEETIEPATAVAIEHVDSYSDDWLRRLVGIGKDAANR
jgi:hypothetical protein